jgi:peptide/nickel transport system substrate-binding protein
MRILLVAIALVIAASGPSVAQPSETVTLGFRNLPFSLEPHVLELNASLVNGNIFDRLVQRTAKGDLEPALATSWKWVSDTVLEFKLRRSVKFHNGEALTADDVTYSFQRALDPTKKLSAGGQMHGVKTVQIVDADTVRVITDKPFPALIPLLAGFAIVPGKYVEKVGDQAFAAAPVGTGPWRFVEWKRDQYIRLEAFDQHWRGKPPFRHLVVRSVPDVSTRMAELKTGGIDLVWWPPVDIIPELERQPNLHVSSVPGTRVHYIALDMRVPPFDNKLVRQAANYAIDKEALIQKLMGGRAVQVATVLSPLVFAYDREVAPYPYDPKKARELLAQAGYPNGVDITLHCASAVYQTNFEVMGQMLTEVGIRTTTKRWEFGPAWWKFFQGEGKATNGYYWDVARADLDPHGILYSLYHTEPAGWVGKWYARIPGFDALIDQAQTTSDPAQRKRLYARMQRIIRDEAPTIFLFAQHQTLAMSKRLDYHARPDEALWMFEARVKR